MTVLTLLMACSRRLAGGALSVFIGLLAVGLLLASAGGRLAHAAGATIIIVNPGGSIQAAINGANPNDTIQINAGTYTESLTLSKTVNLLGADPATTIIQAAPGQRVITVTGTLVNASVIIANLTFQGGMITNALDCPDNCGGGMLILTGTTAPQLQNLVFRNNAAHLGGGLFAGTSVTLTGSLFTNNVATLEGGGLHIANSANAAAEYTVRISNTQFISNSSAGDGGGAYVFGTAIIDNSWFERNRATGGSVPRGGGLISRYLTMSATSFYTNFGYLGGGGVYNTIAAHITGGVFQANSGFGFGGGLNARGVVVVTGTQFISNTSETGGGGLVTYFGGLGDQSSVTGAYFERNICTFNNCTGGGMMAVDGAMLAVSGTDFVSNTSRGSGGGLYSGLALTLTGGLFQGNTCTGGGCGGGGLAVANFAWVSGLTVRNNNAQFGGGGAFLLGEAHLTDAVFQDNACGASNCRGGGVHAENSLTLTNTQLIHNTSVGAGGGLAQVGAGDLRVVNGLFARNVAGAPGLGLWAASPGSAQVLHTTFANPSVVTGAAVAVENGSLGLTNTIVSNYSVGISLTSGSAFEDYTLFFGVATPTAGGVTSGSHHPTGNPLFANPAADNYHISSASPAKDAGFDVGVDFDVDGDARPLGGGFDLGYDEFPIVRVYLPVVVK